MSDIYYNPERFGLTIVWDSDPGGGYDWDTVTVFGSVISGALWAGHDSGCSCNSPFDSLTGLDSINELDRLDPTRGRDHVRSVLADLLAEVSDHLIGTDADRAREAAAGADRVMAWRADFDREHDAPPPPAPELTPAMPVEITATPDGADRTVSPETLTAIDRLAHTLPHDQPWQIDVLTGRTPADTVHLTARPGATEGNPA